MRGKKERMKKEKREKMRMSEKGKAKIKKKVEETRDKGQWIRF